MTPTIVAHRGLHKEYPENSLEAMTAAWAAGFRWCECDVHLSADCKPVVIHDATLERTTEGAGKVRDYDCSHLRKLRLRARNGLLSESHLPRLKSVVRAMPAEAGLLVEIKPSDADGEEIAGVTLELLRKGYRLLIMSFDAQLMRYICSFGGVPSALLVDDALRLHVDGPWDVIFAKHQLLDDESVKRIKGRGKSCGAWTVNEESDIRRMMSLQLDTIITDDPLLARDICTEIG